MDEIVHCQKIGEALSHVILLDLCSPSATTTFKKDYNLEEIENAGTEYFYLMMFLLTVSCQIVFSKDEKQRKTILDAFHKAIIEQQFILPLQILEAQEIENQTRIRYKQYFKLLHTKEDNFDLEFMIRQLPYDFFANVLKKDVDYIFNNSEFKEQWGMATVKLSIYIGEMLKGLNKSIEEIKQNLGIKNSGNNVAKKMRKCPYCGTQNELNRFRCVNEDCLSNLPPLQISTVRKDKNLFELLKNAAKSEQAKIGFHRYRNQKQLLSKLETIGLKKFFFEDARLFIKNKIINDSKAFDALRDYIHIEMNHKGKVWCWDGYGNIKTLEQFYKKEIIFNLEPSLDYMFTEVLEGLKNE